MENKSLRQEGSPSWKQQQQHWEAEQQPGRGISAGWSQQQQQLPKKQGLMSRWQRLMETQVAGCCSSISCSADQENKRMQLHQQLILWQISTMDAAPSADQEKKRAMYGYLLIAQPNMVKEEIVTQFFLRSGNASVSMQKYQSNSMILWYKHKYSWCQSCLLQEILVKNTTPVQSSLLRPLR